MIERPIRPEVTIPPKRKKVTKNKQKLIGYQHTSITNYMPTSKQTNCKMKSVIV